MDPQAHYWKMVAIYLSARLAYSPQGPHSTDEEWLARAEEVVQSLIEETTHG